MVTTRGTRKQTQRYDGIQQWDDIDFSESDNEGVPPRRRRCTPRRSAKAEDALHPITSNNNGSVESNGIRGKTRAQDANLGQSNRGMVLKTYELDSSDDELSFMVSDSARRPRQAYRMKFPNVTQLAVDACVGAQLSNRLQDSTIVDDVREYQVLESDSDEVVQASKSVGVRETFKMVPIGDPFRARHMETCFSCGEASDSTSLLVYCQGCCFAYHQHCLGPRSHRDHLVTKISDGDFVLQCRKCVNVVKLKDGKAPDQAKCQGCGQKGDSCSPFRSKKTTVQEQRDRDENNGEDPTFLVHSDLINNPKNVLFRCVKCSRGYHYEHLLPRHDDEMDVEQSEKEISDARFHDYSTDWQCKDCWLASGKKLSTIVAWRPVDVSNQSIELSLQDFKEDEKEYLIKWDSISYHHVDWMSGSWVWGVTNPSARKSFARRNPPMKLTTEEAIPEEFLAIDIVLDVKHIKAVDIHSEEIDRAHIHNVDKALVKYKGLPYEEAVWEKAPRPEDGSRWTEFVTAFNDWVLGCYTKLPLLGPLRQSIVRIRSQGFGSLEKQSQTDNLTGGKLMNYQLEGLNWIYHSWHARRNCILADEMGLGKTIQVISWMAMMIQDHNCYPFLIVVPNSTCLNWRREIKQWAPTMRIVTYYGSSRARQLAHEYELFPNGKKEPDLCCHAVITSYETAADTSAAKFFKSVPWQGLIVDEGQRLKNDKSLLHKALKSMNAPFRLLLTGTPLQNNTRELFNLLQFLDDSIDAADMEAKYSDMTNKKIARLHEHIRPYILRRTKKQVLGFLPSVSQTIVPVTMSPLQKTVYKSILLKNTEFLKALFNETTIGRTERASMNNVLMQLRKCLCHPFVYSKQIEDRDLQIPILHRNLVEGSSKLQFLENLLPKLKERGHRVLIFSQFLDMLDIIEDFLTSLGMSYGRLDGSLTSLEKQKRIEVFNEKNSPVFAFLLSTRAGGVGINLATADTVIILDPDFNPHQDLQAIARAHRIGQTKKVMVFQLVTKGSAEEKIIQTGRNKMALDHVIVGQMNEEDLAQKDMQSILRHGAVELFSDKEKAKDLHYDDASVEKLIETAQSEDTEMAENQMGESRFSFARVWADSDKLQDPPKYDTPERPPNPSFWEKIIRERERTAEKEATAKAQALGRGKRARTCVAKSNTYNEEIEIDNEIDDDYEEYEDEDETVAGVSKAGIADRAISNTKTPKSERVETPKPLLVPSPDVEIQDNSSGSVTTTFDLESSTVDIARMQPEPSSPACTSCKLTHIDSCQLNAPVRNDCNLYLTEHSDSGTTCPHVVEQMIKMTLTTLEAPGEDKLLVDAAMKYIRGTKCQLMTVKDLA
jgi:chromodomain-helicase-DNA-binding protein 4